MICGNYTTKSVAGAAIMPRPLSIPAVSAPTESVKKPTELANRYI